MKNKKFLTATNIIILICIVVYFVDWFILGGSIEGEFSIVFAGIDVGKNKLFQQILGFNYGKLYEFMALTTVNGKILNFWQPFTYIFMHQFLLHLIFNLIALSIVGNKIEKEENWSLTLFIFIIVGVVGVLICDAIVPADSSAAGTSIALFGLIGAALGMCFTNKGFIKTFSKKSIIYLVIYGLLFTYTSGTWTMVAHNTGLILGLLIYLVYYFLFKPKHA